MWAIWKARVVPALWGAGGMVLVLVVVFAVWETYVGWERAKNGETAFECLNNAPCVIGFIQAAQRYQAPAPPKP